MWLIGFVCVGFLGLVSDITSCEPLTGQRLVAVAAIETVTVPGLVAKGDTAGNDHLSALGASGGVFILVAFNAYQISQSS